MSKSKTAPKSTTKKASPAKSKSTAAKGKKAPAKSTAKQSGKPRATRTPAPAPSVQESNDIRPLSLQLLPLLLLLIALLLGICLLAPDHMGLAGGWIHAALCGLLGAGGYLIPILCLVLALMLLRKNAAWKSAGLKFLWATVINLFTASLLQIWALPENPHTFDVKMMWENGRELLGGGVLGGVLGEAAYVVFGGWGSPIVLIALLLLCVLFFFDLTPYTIFLALSNRIALQKKEMARKERLAREEQARIRRKRYAMRPVHQPPVQAPHPRPTRTPELTRNRHSIQIPMHDFDEPIEATAPTAAAKTASALPSSKSGNQAAASASAPITVIPVDAATGEVLTATAPTQTPAAKRAARLKKKIDAIPEGSSAMENDGILQDVTISIYGQTQSNEAPDTDVTPDPEPVPSDLPLSPESSAVSTAQADPTPISLPEPPFLPESDLETELPVPDLPALTDDDRAPWEDPDDFAEASTLEQLPPIASRKTPEIPSADGSVQELDQVISDDVMAEFMENQQSRPEGGEIDESGMIQAVETEDPEAEFALAIERLKEMEGILPAENRISPVEEPLPPYELPPVTLLRPGDDNRGKDVSEELNTNATKLVDTLRSFRVRTKLVAISRGPAITRYELAPEEGVKVRSIANLVDDIALNLASTGVRIEAPIPGKSAVGVEVPNKSVELVALRQLIETSTFQSASSLLMVCLGMDVAGAPIYLDIAKMPHLLIAGTTGSGKSVSINCMLVSLLYHANPDQVKLILIDPKKVELNIYNGLPHLLVPVVSEPKRAAGALHWAVTEMERRFEMIEAAGVRDLKHYNAQIEGDPSKEFLPQIVIIIDELADLMMTARDEVETSICRIAQKARAAGMHLIIGTQRPSVDVVTGVIKANVPSRISFKVAGQMDSRVILDMAGAEKLIGNGDMLYAPVGCNKPIRVQGAFVSSEEVDEIVTFIKNQSRASYDASIISSIDEAAENCGTPRRGGGMSDDFPASSNDDPGENDPMLKKAIELAVESGKISTSLIQRRLSLGYGRAAKLIDSMETMGIVGPPEGQKPRQVLITADQYTEMVAGGFNDNF